MRLAHALSIATMVATTAAAQQAPLRQGEAPPLRCTPEMRPCVQACTTSYNTCVGIRDGGICRPIQERCIAACRARHCR